MTVTGSETNTENTLSQQKPDATLNQANVAQPAVPPEVKEPGDAYEDPNFKSFREARKKDRAERMAAEQRAAEKEAEANALKAAMEAAFSKVAPVQQNHPYNTPYPTEETEDERIEKKVQAAIAERERHAERLRIEREQRDYPDRLQSIYNDFNNTVSQENLDYLDYHYPEVSRPLQRLNDGFDKWSDIYKAVKKFVPNHASAKRDSARADINYAKPKSISSTGMTQSGEAPSPAKLSEDRKAANWARMQATMNRLG